MSKQEQLARSGRGFALAPATPAQAAIAKDPTLGLVPAYFTENELRALTGVCRDAENENASRILKAALARGAVK